MIDSVFRQYDIRGKVGSELLIDEVYNFGLALAFYFLQRKSDCQNIVVGMDGRTHSPHFKIELIRALTDSGLTVYDIGVCPTPVMYFSLFNYDVDAGIIITASHNTKEYNGFKICFARESIWGQEIQHVKELFKKGCRALADNKGLVQAVNAKEEYIEMLAQKFSHLKSFSLPFIIDCANGAAGSVVPALVERMDWSACTLLYPEIDGTYPYHEADPTVDANMADLRKAVLSQAAQLGIGLDGDCDRMAPLDEQGNLIFGDKLLSLFAETVYAHMLQKPPVIFDTKCSSGLNEVLERNDIPYSMSPSGHSIIKDQMKKHQAVLAGELSCHFFFKDNYYGYDDGIYAMMRLLDILNKTGKNLGALLENFPKKFNTPEMRVFCHDDQTAAILQDLRHFYAGRQETQFLTIDGLRVIMPDGWAMVRASNTQPVICLRFESDTQKGLNRIKQEFKEILKAHIAVHELQGFM